MLKSKIENSFLRNFEVSNNIVSSARENIIGKKALNGEQGIIPNCLSSHLLFEHTVRERITCSSHIVMLLVS